MSAPIVMAIWNYQGKDLNGVQTAIFARMGWYASDAGRDIFPSVNTLSLQTKFGETAVREAIKHLIANSFLIQVETSTGRHSNKYNINLAKLGITNQFTSSSSTIPSAEPLAKRRVENEPLAKRRVNPSPDEANPSPDEPNRLLNTNFKNNNVVVDEKLFELATKAGISSAEVEGMVTGFGKEQVAMQLKYLSRQTNVANPLGWVLTALKKNFKASPKPEGQGSSNPIYNPSSNEIWSPELQARRNREAEKLASTSWQDKAIAEKLKQIQAGN